MAALSGAFAARVAEVMISNAASTDFTTATYVDVEKNENGEFGGTQDRAESSNNDDSGNKTYVTTWRDANLSFEMIADEIGGTGQEHCWTSWAAGETRAFQVQPQGHNTGSKRIRFLGQILSITQPFPKSDPGRYKVTVGRTGTQTRDAQP